MVMSTLVFYNVVHNKQIILKSSKGHNILLSFITINYVYLYIDFYTRIYYLHNGFSISFNFS